MHVGLMQDGQSITDALDSTGLSCELRNITGPMDRRIMQRTEGYMFVTTATSSQQISTIMGLSIFELGLR
jgi:hypothetical protein